MEIAFYDLDACFLARTDCTLTNTTDRVLDRLLDALPPFLEQLKEEKERRDRAKRMVKVKCPACDRLDGFTKLYANINGECLICHNTGVVEAERIEE
jgi:hypothetical protein